MSNRLGDQHGYKEPEVNWRDKTMEVMNSIKQIQVCTIYKMYCTVGKCKIKKKHTGPFDGTIPPNTDIEVDGYRFTMFSGKEIIYTKEFEGDTDEHCYVLCASVYEDILDAGIQYIYAIAQEEKKIHNAVNKTLVSKGLGQLNFKK